MRTFEAWKVGRKGLDDGLVLFILAQDRKLRIEVGYGLEGQMPDAIASRIIRETITPRLSAGDWDGAVNAGVERILTTLGGGDPSRPANAQDPAGAAEPGTRADHSLRPPGPGVPAAADHPSEPGDRAPLQHPFRGPGRRWRGGGGGWSGGGGRSGGGGASGSW